jgi:hypothetical protein
VTVLSSLLPCADFVGELSSSWYGKVGVRSVSTPQGSFPHCLCWHSFWSVVVAAGEYRSGGSCELVGHGNHDNVLVGPGVQSIEPCANRESISFHASHGCSRAMNQEFAQVYVAVFTDTQQPGLAAGRILPGARCRAMPQTLDLLRKAASLPMAATMAVATTGPMPGMLRAAAAGISGRDLFQLVCQLFDLLLNLLPLTPQRIDQVAQDRRKIGFGVLKNIGHGGLELRGVWVKTRPRSRRNARIWLITAVRREISRSRTRWLACWSS